MIEPRVNIRGVGVAAAAIYAALLPLEGLLPSAVLENPSRVVAGIAVAAAIFLCIRQAKVSFGGAGEFLLAASLFAGWVAASALWSIDPSATIGRIRFYVQAVVLMFAMIVLCARSSHVRLLLLGYAGGAFVTGLLLILEMGALQQQGVSLQRLTIAGWNPNWLAYTLVLAIPMAWWLAITAEREAVRALIFIFLPILLGGVVLTGSRGGFIAAMVALGIIPMTLSKQRPLIRALLFGALLGSAAAGWQFIPSGVGARLMTMGAEFDAGHFSGRSMIWAAGLELFQDRWLIGTGAGTFREAVVPYARASYAPHNAFLAIATETGVAGLTLFLALILSGFMVAFRTRGQGVALWVTLYLTLIVTLLPANLEARKATWFVLTLPPVALVAQRNSKRISQESSGGFWGVRKGKNPQGSSGRDGRPGREANIYDHSVPRPDGFSGFWACFRVCHSRISAYEEQQVSSRPVSTCPCVSGVTLRRGQTEPT